MKYAMKNRVLSLAVLTLCGLFAAGCPDKDSHTGDIESEPAKYHVSASDIAREYKGNAVAADQKYKGEIVVISGTVASIDKMGGDNHVILEGERDCDIDCIFSRSEEFSVARITKGEAIAVKGQVAGKRIDVVVTKCRLD